MSYQKVWVNRKTVIWYEIRSARTDPLKRVPLTEMIVRDAYCIFQPNTKIDSNIVQH